VTIKAQFGPVGVNNPNILMRNATLPPLLESSPYETRRIGPTPLPVFTPPPLPPTSRAPTFRGQNYGPDWTAIEGDKATKKQQQQPLPTSTAAVVPTPANITVERPIHGLPYAKMETTTRATTTTPSSTTTTSATTTTTVQQTTEHPTSTSSAPITTRSPASPSVESAASQDDDEDEETIYDDQICWETMIGQEIVRLVTMVSWGVCMKIIFNY
jgi:hypothetical protein